MSLARAVRSENTKLFTTSSWWVLLLVLAGYVAMMVGSMAAAFGVGTDEMGLPVGASLTAMLYGLAVTIGYVLPLLLGVLMVTGEFRYATLTPTFLATPRRGTVLLAKVVVAAVVGALYGVVAMLVSVGTGAGVLSLFGLETSIGDTDTWTLVGRGVLAYALWAVIGVGVGALVRNQVAAIVLVLAFTQLVEPMLRVAGALVDWLADVVDYLPGAASDALVGSSFFSMMGGGAGTTMQWWEGAVLLAGYAVVFLILGGISSWRRDVT